VHPHRLIIFDPFARGNPREDGVGRDRPVDGLPDDFPGAVIEQPLGRGVPRVLLRIAALDDATMAASNAAAVSIREVSASA
jgi:hypothetical protein